MLELLSTVFGLIQGILVMLNKRCNWIFYSLQMVFLVLFSIDAHLWGDVAIDSIYFIVGIVAFFSWRKGRSTASISVYGLKARIVWMFATLLAIAVSWSVLRNTDNPLPLLDSITSVTGIVATWFMFRHKLEAWMVWFVNDIFYIVEYVMLPDMAVYLIGLYVIWAIFAVVSYINWQRIYASSSAAANS